MELEFQAILPNTEFKPQVLLKELDKSYRKLAGQLRRDVEATQNNWKKKTKPKVKKTKGSSISYTVTIDSEVWHWLNSGTGLYGPKKKKYEIKAKNAPMLRFNTNYSPKSQPGVLKSSGPGISSGPVVMTKKVMHPGIRPRNWSKILRDRFEKKAIQEADRILRWWVQNYVTAPGGR
jgi:hypothetical protein